MAIVFFCSPNSYILVDSGPFMALLGDKAVQRRSQK